MMRGFGYVRVGLESPALASIISRKTVAFNITACMESRGAREVGRGGGWDFVK